VASVGLAYVGTDAEQRTFSLYAEFVSEDGAVRGHLKPILLELQCLPLQQAS
jgi:hypothetical protein